jgi:hypothetical protein
MPADHEHRRVLVVADPSAEDRLRELFTAPPLARWQFVPAGSFDRARFVLQHEPCNVLLLDRSVCTRDGAEAFGWLARRHRLPCVTLAVAPAAADHPDVLAAALDRAAVGGQGPHQPRLHDALAASRPEVDRPVGL